MRTMARAATAAGFALGIASCTSGTGSSGPPACTVTGVTVTANPATVSVGATTTLTATLNASGTCGSGLNWSATPAGGTLAPGGTTATFSSATAGNYTISVSSVADPTKSGSASVTVTPVTAACGTPNGTVVTHSGNVAANESWAGDGVTHSVPNSISITFEMPEST